MRSSDLVQKVDDAIGDLTAIREDIEWFKLASGKDKELAAKLKEEKRILDAVFGKRGIYSQLEAEITKLGSSIDKLSETITHYEDFVADRLSEPQERALIKKLCGSTAISKSVAQQTASKELERLKGERTVLEAKQSDLMSKSQVLGGFRSSDSGMALDALDKMLDSGVVHSGQTQVGTKIFPTANGSSSSGNDSDFDALLTPSRKGPIAIFAGLALIGATALYLAISSILPPRLSEDPKKSDVAVASVADKDAGVSDAPPLVPVDLRPVVLEGSPEPVADAKVASAAASKPVPAEPSQISVNSMLVEHVGEKTYRIRLGFVEGTKLKITIDLSKENPYKDLEDYLTAQNVYEKESVLANVKARVAGLVAEREKARIAAQKASLCVTDPIIEAISLGEQCVNDGSRPVVVQKETHKPAPESSVKSTPKPVDYDAAKVSRKIQYKLSCEDQERKALLACKNAGRPICVMPRCRR